MTNPFEKNINGIELPKSLQERLALWSGLISDSGISPEIQRDFLAVLKSAQKNFYANYEVDFILQLENGWAHILTLKNPEIFKIMSQLNRREKYGENITIEVSPEDQLLINLYLELQSDLWAWKSNENKYD